MKKFKFKIEGTDYEVVINDIENNIATVEVNGKSYTVEVEKDEAVRTPVKRKAAPHREEAPAAAPAPTAKRPVAKGGGSILNAPLPGTITSVVAKVGQEVKADDVVLIVESMKMENNILAGSAGTIKNIFVTAGQNVMQGDALVEIA